MKLPYSRLILMDEKIEYFSFELFNQDLMKRFYADGRSKSL